MIVEFRLTGTTTHLMHHDSVEGEDVVNEWLNDPDNKKRSKPGDDRTPPWKWQIYLSGDGERVVIPSGNVMSCLLRAGTQVKAGKGAKTLKEASQTAVFPLADYYEFRFGERLDAQLELPQLAKVRNKTFAEQAAWAKKCGFHIDVRPVRVGDRRHIRTRPAFRNWLVTGQVDLTDDDLPFDKLKLLFDIAGSRVGLGDWRPSAPKKPGRHGMFRAELAKAA